MKSSLAACFSLFAISTHAAFLSVFNSTIIIIITSTSTTSSSSSTATTTTTTITTITTPTITTTTTTPSSTPSPTPPTYLVQCAASMDDLCSSICFCGGSGSGSGRDLNCHADPSAQCRNMCRCVPENLLRNDT
ncbi:hypothetical protein F5B17DRAFT_37523 [Nemania serpens]|nr:hypothetical protein F5B17DRAFT_37523 [Nemania serpens]